MKLHRVTRTRKDRSQKIPLTMYWSHPETRRWIVREGSVKLARSPLLLKVVVVQDSEAMFKMKRWINHRIWKTWKDDTTPEDRKCWAGFCCGLQGRRFNWSLDGKRREVNVHHEGDPRFYAVVLLDGSQLDANFVIHECYHAMMRFRERSPRYRFADNAEEEFFAYPMGEIAGTVMKWLWPDCQKNPFAIRRPAAKMRASHAKGRSGSTTRR